MLNPKISLLCFNTLLIPVGACGDRSERADTSLSQSLNAATATATERAQRYLDLCLSEGVKANSELTTEKVIARTRKGVFRFYDELKTQDPAVISSLSAQVEAASCQSRTQGELAALAYLLNFGPTIPTSGAIGCLLTQQKNVEDVVLWDTLDAWVSIGRPLMPEVMKVDAAAKSFATRRRFMTPQEISKYVLETAPTTILTASIVTGDGSDL